MAQVDDDLAQTTIALKRVCKLLGFTDTQAMGTQASVSIVSAALQPLLTFANKATLPGSQAPASASGVP